MRNMPHHKSSNLTGKAVALQGSAGSSRDDAKLDAWLTNPQQISRRVMAYRQAKPETRAAIIAYLKELN